VEILCVADQVDPLVYSQSVKERFCDVEMVISAGDLPMSFLGFLASSLNKPVVFVFGNHNLKELKRFQGRRSPAEMLQMDYDTPAPSYGATYADGKVRRVKGLLIAGLGGSIRYNEGEHQFSEGQMRRRIFRLIPRLLINRLFFGRFLDIFVTHAPPRYIHDREDLPHHGFECFRWFLKVFRPRYHLHGHIHLYDLNAPRITDFNETRVINVFSYYVLNTENSE
jgi:Icc-related predicted phosphoesterase